MSGSGGFNKYRCKFFLTHNCNNWVWVNGGECAMCMANGYSDPPKKAETAKDKPADPKPADKK
ncbi:hypothetical protein B0T19DRAFT_446164 [Cercophora scortea]|uniref:Uncharacterized protein n=1 Tax=Cercophora scortea TaxID=314031 RepID=A0AAE0I239_9PEZI|nr:hypothetical protein B0T19DRAFT_446164 [Cercophora scortea]